MDDPYDLADNHPDAYRAAAANFGFADLDVGELVETMAGADVAEFEKQLAEEIIAHT